MTLSPTRDADSRYPIPRVDGRKGIDGLSHAGASLPVAPNGSLVNSASSRFHISGTPSHRSITLRSGRFASSSITSAAMPSHNPAGSPAAIVP
jgi:hypothetical protein